MNEEFYEVYDEFSNILGKHMTRQNALIFIDALLTKYYNDTSLIISITRERNEENE